jgi:hypothetical protein
MLKRILLLVVFIAFALASPARAEDYVKPDWPSLVKTLVRFNALDISDDRLLDEYAMITECDLYKSFYRDDFKWNQVRNAMRQSIKMNVATFPTSYRYETQLQLDRYDFHDKIYRLTDKSVIHNVNAFEIYSVSGSPCAGIDIVNIPHAFRAVLDTPLYFEGLPLAQADAEALLNRMKIDNPDRIVYTRFNLRVVYIESLRPPATGVTNKPLVQSNAQGSQSARLDVRLDSIEFYEDPAMTKLIYRFQP